jgi:hypothetical protein
LSDYSSVVRDFAALGSRIYQTDPTKHYGSIGTIVKRPLEPGFIPPDCRPRFVSISYYPNESEIAGEEYRASRSSLDAWGRSGGVEEYIRAYNDWVALLPKIPFFRDFNEPIIRRINLTVRDFAWLPLVKCPLPARTIIPEDDRKADRDWLWDQLRLLEPRVVLAQGVDTYNLVRRMCEDRFSAIVVLQKIGRVGTNAEHQAEDDRVARKLGDALAAAENVARQ